MAHEEVTLANIDRRLRIVEGADSSGMGTDVALVKRDLRWVIGIGAAIIAILGYVYFDIDSTLDAHGERLARMEERLARIENTLDAHGEGLAEIKALLNERLPRDR